MKYLRMISNINHWDKGKMNLYPGCFSTGDILLSNLRTNKNTLSLWSFDDESEKKELIVAMALSRQHIQKLVYVVMDDEGIEKLGIPLEFELGNADGITKQEILEKHANMTKIDFWRLGYVAEYLCELVNEDEKHGFVTDKDLFKMMKSCVEEGVLDIEQMNDSLKESYKKHLEKNIKQ